MIKNGKLTNQKAKDIETFRFSWKPKIRGYSTDFNTFVMNIVWIGRNRKT